jgi:hypothetical protein
LKISKDPRQVVSVRLLSRLPNASGSTGGSERGIPQVAANS